MSASERDHLPEYAQGYQDACDDVLAALARGGAAAVRTWCAAAADTQHPDPLILTAERTEHTS